MLELIKTFVGKWATPFLIIAGVSLLSYALIQSARIDSINAKFEGAQSALTANQQALEATQGQVIALQAIRRLEGDILAKLEALQGANRSSAISFQAAQDSLERKNEQSKAFLDCPTGDDLRSLLDREDGLQ